MYCNENLQNFNLPISLCLGTNPRVDWYIYESGMHVVWQLWYVVHTLVQWYRISMLGRTMTLLCIIIRTKKHKFNKTGLKASKMKEIIAPLFLSLNTLFSTDNGHGSHKRRVLICSINTPLLGIYFPVFWLTLHSTQNSIPTQLNIFKTT